MAPGNPIRVLIIDDMTLIHKMLTAMLETDPDIQVVGVAKNGELGVEQTLALKPDVIIMDLHMPVMDGFDATREIMAICPTPILIMSCSHVISERNAVFNALKMGALDVMKKPNGLGLTSLSAIGQDIIRKVKRFARVKVIRHIEGKRKPHQSSRQIKTKAPSPSSYRENYPSPREENLKLLAIGASTGGPKAIVHLLSELPGDFPLPIALVQHITDGFSVGFAHWLNHNIALETSLVQPGEKLLPGHVYIAPNGHHLRVTSNCVAQLSEEPQEFFHRPSIDVLFHSLAENFGSQGVAVLLTGMGDDGAEGLWKLYREKGRVYVQDEASCTIFGMPRQALAKGVKVNPMSPSQIGRDLKSEVKIPL